MIEYSEIYRNLASTLKVCGTNDTKSLTYLIKRFFYESYPNLYVAGFNGNKEYLFDVAVLSCSPEDMYHNLIADYNLHLAVESELGGTSASSSKGVEINVISDFSKLLFANSNQKILIAAHSIPHNKKGAANDELLRLIAKLKDINDKSSNSVDVLIILIKGDHTSGNSRQVKICTPIEVNGYILQKNRPSHSAEIQK